MGKAYAQSATTGRRRPEGREANEGNLYDERKERWTMITGSLEHRTAVDGELTRITEELYRLHDGDPSYMTWLKGVKPGAHELLIGMPEQIELVRGLVPF